jgi:hypothetical protein
MAIFFEDIFNDGAQSGVVFKKAPTAAGGTALTAGGAAALNLGSAATNPGIYFGSGAPTLTAPQGSLYIRSDGSSTSTRLYVNTTGSTTWTNVTTAA